MNCGCLLFAHNGEIDYGSQAVLAAKLVVKHLKVPVHLVTDKLTYDDLTTKFTDLPFASHSIIDFADTNKRRLNNEMVKFNNGSRASAYDLTPFERTLVIDTDFLIFNDNLNSYWQDPHDFLITPGMLELTETRLAPTEYEVSQYTIPMLWATNLMFTKNDYTKILFDLVAYIRQEYEYFSKLYEFNPWHYRNDFAFSIACHMMNGYSSEKWHGELPVPLLFTEEDYIVDIKNSGQINFITPQDLLIKTKDQNVHLMNKRDILKNLDKLMELANV
jgi:hypothetical protein